jgi:hypothetical protein
MEPGPLLQGRSAIEPRDLLKRDDQLAHILSGLLDEVKNLGNSPPISLVVVGPTRLVVVRMPPELE